MEKKHDSGYPEGVETALSCSMCGAEVAADAKTCGACGAIIVPRSEPPPPMLPTAESGAGRRAALVGGALALLAVIGAVALRGGDAGKPPAADDLRRSREAIEAEWEAKRDRYFALVARVELVAREDMDQRRVVLHEGAWSKLSEAEQRDVVDLLALKTSARLSEPKRGGLELVEGTQVVARYEPGRGVVLR